MPLLVDAEGEEAIQIAVDIALDLSKWMDAGGDFSDDAGSAGEFACQHAGICLMFLELSRVTGDARWRDRAASCWARSVEKIGENICGPDFFAGFTGAAWVGGLLERSIRIGNPGASSELANDDDDVFSEIDAAVLSVLRRGRGMHPDLLGGLSGLGIYLASRIPRRRAIEGLERLVNRLDQSASVDARGIYWTPMLTRLPPGFDRTRFSEGCVPLGVAHGLAGILSVVARAKEAGVAAKTAARLFEGGVRFLLATRLPPHSQFTFAASIHQDGSVAEPAASWCWGDIGIIGALYFAAVRVGHVELEKAMVEAAVAAASVLPASCPMRDASLCHGTAGRAHILNRLHESIGGDALATASREWFRTTIAARGREGFGGYRFFVRADGDLRTLASPGLLVGSAGVALAFLSACSTQQPFWDMPFAVDLPRPFARRPCQHAS